MIRRWLSDSFPLLLVIFFAGTIPNHRLSRGDLIANGTVIGVLDLDSPILNRFDEVDVAGLESIVAMALQASDVSNV